MAPEGVKRKISAILGADVVGYSKLMEDGSITKYCLADSGCHSEIADITPHIIG